MNKKQSSIKTLKGSRGCAPKYFVREKRSERRKAAFYSVGSLCVDLSN
jgi:hypothetical protein